MKFNPLIFLFPIVIYSQNPSSVTGSVVDMKLNEGLANVHEELRRRIVIQREEEASRTSELLEGDLGKLFQKIGIDPSVGTALLARSTEEIQKALQNLDTFDLNEARDEIIRTSTDAKKAADALEIFRRQLRNIRLEAMSPARRILTEGEERRKRAGRLTEGQRRRRGEPQDKPQFPSQRAGD